MQTINLRPIQTGDVCYLTDHHNRDGECILTVTMCDGCDTAYLAQKALREELRNTDRVPYCRIAVDTPDFDGAARWCAAEWLAAQADMPAETDRDSDGDDDARYLECHILATWEV